MEVIKTTLFQVLQETTNFMVATIKMNSMEVMGKTYSTVVREKTHLLAAKKTMYW